MAAAALNTLHYARRLKTAGVPDRQAEEMAEVLVAHIPTKADFAETSAVLKTDFAGLRTELKADIAALDKRLDTTAGELRADTRTEIAALRAEMHAEFKNLYRYLWLMAVGIVALTVTLTVTLTKALS